MPDYCCQMMQNDLTTTCDHHPRRWDCPDALIHFSEDARVYGIMVHDAGESFLRITYCPWCGTNLVKHEEVHVVKESSILGKMMADDLLSTLDTEDRLRKLSGMPPIPRTPGGLPLLPGMHKPGGDSVIAVAGHIIGTEIETLPIDKVTEYPPGAPRGHYLNTDTGKVEVWCEATQTWEEKP